MEISIKVNIPKANQTDMENTIGTTAVTLKAISKTD